MSVPTRFPQGMTNVPETNPMAMFRQSDPSTYHMVWDDFDVYTAANWVVTESDAAATQALTAGDGGLLLITNGSLDDGLTSMQSLVANFAMSAGKKAFFKCRFKVSDATQSDVMVGLVIVDTSPFASAPTDGIYFRKDDGDANIDFSVRKDASTGANDVTTVGTLVSDTYVTLAWYYDGVDKVLYYVDDVLRGQASATSAFLPDATNLAVTIALQNGEAVAKTMTIDYVLAAKER